MQKEERQGIVCKRKRLVFIFIYNQIQFSECKRVDSEEIKPSTLHAVTLSAFEAKGEEVMSNEV